MKKRLKVIILYLISVTVSVLPLLLTVILKRGEYIKAPSDAVRLSFGCLVALLFIFAKVIGRLNMPKGVGLYTLVFVLAWLLKPLLSDLVLLSGMALLGECLDFIIARPLIRRAKEKIFIDKNAKATEELFKKYIGGGK